MESTAGSDHPRRKRPSNFDVLPPDISSTVPAPSSSSNTLQSIINNITANAVATNAFINEYPGAPPSKFTERLEAAMLKNFEYIQRLL